jgi:hypothetical protein
MLSLISSLLVSPASPKREGYGAGVSSELFRFLQAELPFALGPADGRWLVRREGDGEVERVLVLRTIGARRSDEPSRRKRPVASASAEQLDPIETSVQVTRATIIDAATLPRDDADAWLSAVDPQTAVQDTFRWLNRLLHAYRIAAVDPYVEELGAEHALALRAGYGEGEHVADGRWLRAISLPSPPLRRRSKRRESNRDARTQERLAALLGGRLRSLLCEELALRARRDLDEGRTRVAAVELERAYAAALVELTDTPATAAYVVLVDAGAVASELGQTLAERVAELREVKPQVTETAVAALSTGRPFDAVEAALATDLKRLEDALLVRVASLLHEGAAQGA